MFDYIMFLFLMIVNYFLLFNLFQSISLIPTQDLCQHLVHHGLISMVQHETFGLLTKMSFLMKA